MRSGQKAISQKTNKMNGSYKMDRSICKKRVKTVIVEHLCVEPELVKEKATFEGDLDADSLDIVDLLLALEEEFDIELNESLVKSIVTVKDVIDHIQRETK